MAAESDREIHLSKALTDVEHLLDIQIDSGEKRLKKTITGSEDLDDAYTEYRGWRDYTETLLEKLFSSGALAKEFGDASGPLVMGISFGQDVKNFQSQLRGKLDVLKSVRRRLTLYDETPTNSTRGTATAETTTPAIFVVHGHDHLVKLEVARFLEKASECEVVILHEKASSGKTTIEKLEHYSGVAAAVVILTADDVGGPKNGDLNPRARQNVVFELGFFVGKLGRASVVVLYEPGVERPSDFEGVVYVKLDEAGAWKLELAKELAASNIPMNP